MNNKWNNGAYEVLGVIPIRIGDDSQWRVDLEIRRFWLFRWIDYRPWKFLFRRCKPVKIFIGQGYAWHELKGDKAFGASGFVPVLNAIVSTEALKMLHAQTESGQKKLFDQKFNDWIEE